MWQVPSQVAGIWKVLDEYSFLPLFQSYSHCLTLLSHSVLVLSVSQVVSFMGVGIVSLACFYFSLCAVQCPIPKSHLVNP